MYVATIQLFWRKIPSILASNALYKLQLQKNNCWMWGAEQQSEIKQLLKPELVLIHCDPTNCVPYYVMHKTGFCLKDLQYQSHFIALSTSDSLKKMTYLRWKVYNDAMDTHVTHTYIHIHTLKHNRCNCYCCKQILYVCQCVIVLCDFVTAYKLLFCQG